MFNIKSIKDLEIEIERDYLVLKDDSPFSIRYITSQYHYEGLLFIIFNFRFFFNQYYISKHLKFNPQVILEEFGEDYLEYLSQSK